MRVLASREGDDHEGPGKSSKRLITFSRQVFESLSITPDSRKLVFCVGAESFQPQKEIPSTKKIGRDIS